MEDQTKICQNCKNKFNIEPDDFSFYEKMKVPAPTFCPSCRFQRRAVYRNERKLFKVKDAFTGEDIFSLIPQESNKKVITQEEWYGDSWDATEHGIEYDFSRTFLSQLKELDLQIPVFNLNAEFMVNSPYSGNATALKNCYLCFNSNYSEDCMYCNGIDYSKDCIDDSHVNHSERCYECFWLQNCYQCYFTIMSAESHNLYFCCNCIGCNDCFGCANLRKLSYCIFNKQYTKENYSIELEKMKLNTKGGIKRARDIARDFWKTEPTKYQHGLKNINSTGSYVTNCKNVNDSYLIKESEDMKYCQYMLVARNKNCYDTTVWGNNSELFYEVCCSGENSSNLRFCFDCWPSCKDLEYCLDVYNSSDCFGCVGLRKKQYCILNKQYEKNEYFALVEKIKKHMDEMPYTDKQGLIYKYGEFFPIEFSYFGYNNTIAMQHFPITKEEAANYGYKWIEVPRGEYQITKKSEQLPNSISGVDDTILEDVIKCDNCRSPFRIFENELIFYRKEQLPLPVLCHDCRYERRISDRLGTNLYERTCMCAGAKDETGNYTNNIKHFHGSNPCEEKFKTGYNPERGDIIYCEKCYQQEVY